MIRLEELRAQAHSLINEATSEQDLERIVAALTKPQNLPLATEEEEARYAYGLQQIAEGNTVTLEEYKKEAKERRANWLAAAAK